MYVRASIRNVCTQLVFLLCALLSRQDSVNDIEDARKPLLRKVINNTHPLTPKEEKCYEDHVRCLLNIHTSSKPMCAYKADQKDGGGGFKAFRTICDAYLTNCFAEYKYWQVFSSSQCVYLAPKSPKHWWGKYKKGYRIKDTK